MIQAPLNSTLESQLSTAQDPFLAGLLDQPWDLNLQNVEAETVVWLEQLRDQAAAQVRQLTVPTTRNEEWRFTDLSPLLQFSFQAPDRQMSLVESAIASWVLPEAAHCRLVFVNGIYTPHLSCVTDLPNGLFVGNLSQSPSRGEALPQSYAQQIQDYLAKQPGAEEVFTALNTACLTDAAIVWVPKNQVVDPPVHLLFISTPGESPAVSQPRCLVVAEPGSALTLIEEYVASGEGVYFTNAVTEIWAQENAQISHTRVQRDSQAAFQIGKTVIAQARDSRYTCHAISLGAKLSRHNLEVFQTGEHTETTLNELTMIAGQQVADTHSAIAYTQPYGTSRQLHKCIVDHQAHAVFNGKVSVPKAAQLTDAGQLNRNLLLSPKARMDTKPQLEITADNVKCSHGATVSQLDAEEVFYLQSRCLDEVSARKLLIHAFAAEMIDQIPVNSLRKVLSQAVL